MSTVHCPICEKPFDSQQSPAAPFCSHRCRLLDLQHWLDEDYGLQHEGEDPHEATRSDP